MALIVVWVTVIAVEYKVVDVAVKVVADDVNNKVATLPLYLYNWYCTWAPAKAVKIE